MDFAGGAVAYPQASRAPSWPGAARRVLDVAFGLLALVVLSPALLVLAVLVRVTSRGPAVFCQQRVGAGGRLFTLYKFRSMSCDSAGPEVTTGADPRVTRVGRLLRGTSLDELPQLLNLVRGDMTLVGPRPETPGLARRYPRTAGGCSPTVPGSPDRSSSAHGSWPRRPTRRPIRRRTTWRCWCPVGSRWTPNSSPLPRSCATLAWCFGPSGTWPGPVARMT